MSDDATIIVFALVIFAVTLAAARIPFVIGREKHTDLHRLITFSAGVMVGVLFLMLLPEALERSWDNGVSETCMAYSMLAGFLLLFVIDFLVEKYLLKGDADEETEHDITSLSAFAALAIHSFFDGLALAAAFIAGEDVGIMVLIALCLHKSVVVFSLSSTMLMSHNHARAWAYLVAFSAISPLAAVISYLAMDTSGLDTAGILLCFSVGIFAFVTFCDMVPEAFRHEKRCAKQLVIFLLGILVCLVVALLTDAMMGGVEI